MHNPAAAKRSGFFIGMGIGKIEKKNFIEVQERGQALPQLGWQRGLGMTDMSPPSL